MKYPVEIAHEMAAWQGAEKMAARKAVEKPRSGKVKKTTFPLRLEIPQPRGIPTFPQPRRLREINQKPDISFTKKRGHF
jgi:hypothetical protein